MEIQNVNKNPIFRAIKEFLQENLPTLNAKDVLTLERAIFGVDGSVTSQDFFSGTHKEIKKEGTRGYIIRFEDTNGNHKSIVFSQSPITTDISGFEYIFSLETISKILSPEGFKKLGEMLNLIKKLDIPKSNDEIGTTLQQAIEKIIVQPNTSNQKHTN